MRRKMFLIWGTVTHITAEGEVTRQLPTFYLNEYVQGFEGEEGAIRVARDLLMAMDPKIRPDGDCTCGPPGYDGYDGCRQSGCDPECPLPCCGEVDYELHLHAMELD